MFTAAGRLSVSSILGACLGVVLAAPVTEAAPELRKVHALVVVDTLSGLGQSVMIDGVRIDRLLRNNLPRDRVEIRILTGKDVNAEAILAYYRTLAVGRDDALFFYYAGHGATDPTQGHFLALQELKAKPLFRADLRQAMERRQPGLVVLLTDCCSTRLALPGKKRRIFVDEGAASAIHPVLLCLLYQSRGVVDITAATGNSSFGDDLDGGIFTRTFDKLVRSGVTASDFDRNGLVTWPEFFARLQTETQGVFVTWAKRQRAIGEQIGQTSQKPHAFALGPSADAVNLRNATEKPLKYQYRWPGRTAWQESSLPPKGIVQQLPPAASNPAPKLEVRFEGGKSAELWVGKMYRFYDTPNSAGSSKTGQ
jgi:hypothetical protein